MTMWGDALAALLVAAARLAVASGMLGADGAAKAAAPMRRRGRIRQ